MCPLISFFSPSGRPMFIGVDAHLWQSLDPVATAPGSVFVDPGCKVLAIRIA
jgi:hypothetical protein